jgi:Zn-dependent protease with chaperone function
MNLTTMGIGLMVFYFALTALAPLALSHPRLLVAKPRLCLALWKLTFTLAALSITASLGLFIALALRHHVTHVAGHDSLAPFIDQILGWLAIGIVGILAFRMGVSVQDARTAVSQMNGEFRIVLASSKMVRVNEQVISVVESSIPLVGARAGRVVATSAMIEKLTPTQLEIVVEHERAHIRRHHSRDIAVANIAEAIAPALNAGKGFASAARITTELIADDDAARVFGNRETAGAILTAYPLESGVAERAERLLARAI